MVAYRREGLDDKGLLDAYPSITQEDLNAVWKYSEEHRDEIEKDIKDQDEAMENEASA